MSNVHGMIRSAYTYDVDKVSIETAPALSGDGGAQQSFKEECDINTILRKFSVTGELPDNVRVPQYGEFEESFDFMSAMNVVRAAEEAFAAMPSDVRERFNNDPARFVEFANDSSNYDEALKMGLVVSRPRDTLGDVVPGSSSPVSAPSRPVPGGVATPPSAEPGSQG